MSFLTNPSRPGHPAFRLYVGALVIFAALVAAFLGCAARFIPCPLQALPSLRFLHPSLAGELGPLVYLVLYCGLVSVAFEGMARSGHSWARRPSIVFAGPAVSLVIVAVLAILGGSSSMALGCAAAVVFFGIWQFQHTRGSGRAPLAIVQPFLLLASLAYLLAVFVAPFFFGSGVGFAALVGLFLVVGAASLLAGVIVAMRHSEDSWLFATCHASTFLVVVPAILWIGVSRISATLYT